MAGSVHHSAALFADASRLIKEISFLFFSSLDQRGNSQTGCRQDLHEDASRAAASAGQSHQMVRLPLVHTEKFRRREGCRRVTRYVQLERILICIQATWLCWPFAIRQSKTAARAGPRIAAP